MKTSESIVNIAGAFVKAQKNITKAHKDAKNPFFGSDYATLSSVWDACNKALLDEDIAVIQPTRVDQCRKYHPRHEEYTNESGNVKLRQLHDDPVAVDVHLNILETTLLHSSGEWIQGEYLFSPVEYTPQGDGSAFTYARRYALGAMVGVCPADDDGNAGSGKKKGSMCPPKSKSSQDLPACPSCGSVDAVIKGKEEYGGGWVCFNKKGGCGNKWKSVSAVPSEETQTDDPIGDKKKKDNVTAIRMLADQIWEKTPDNVKHSNVAKLMGFGELISYNDLSLAQTNRAIKLLNKEVE